MTGHLLVKPATYNIQHTTHNKNYFNDKVNSYVHHIWYLQTKNKKLQTSLEFSDMRKFAKIVLNDTDKIKNLPEIKKLGVDVMSSEFTLKKFKEILKKYSKKQIGIILMDQNIMSGIGNIYRSEILFDAKVHSERKIEKLSEKEKENIYKAIKKVLTKAIKMRGTSDSDYRDTSGAPGNFQKVLKVYRKAGKKCPKCDTIIKRMTLGQRSIFYCPQCQH
jgi:formamidopyrimidine-DNA glycosylase